MQLTLLATRRTPHGASRLVLAMSAWSVKIRRAPSRHCRDARVHAWHDYGHAWHHGSAPPLNRTHVSAVKLLGFNVESFFAVVKGLKAPVDVNSTPLAGNIIPVWCSYQSPKGVYIPVSKCAHYTLVYTGRGERHNGSTAAGSFFQSQ